MLNHGTRADSGPAHARCGGSAHRPTGPHVCPHGRQWLALWRHPTSGGAALHATLRAEKRAGSVRVTLTVFQIGRAHGGDPVTQVSRMGGEG